MGVSVERDRGARDSVLVLIVEDDPHVRMLLHLTFEDEGYRVVAVSNGAEALHTLYQVQPHIVLLDLDLPIITGEQVAAKIRVAPAPSVPVLILSAATNGRSRAECAGAAGYFAKPVDMDALIAGVVAIVGV